MTRLKRITKLVRKWRERRRQRGEPSDYIAGDHRAAADMGVTKVEARNWSQRPFWRE